jgi:hypothetical protein
MIPVYVAAPYVAAPDVRALHARLRAIDCDPTSKWAEEAVGPEQLRDDAADTWRQLWLRNMNDLETAYALVVLSGDGGGEMFVEVGHALALSIPILWTGPRRVLSCYARPRVRMMTVDDACSVLASVAKQTDLRTDARRLLFGVPA